MHNRYAYWDESTQGHNYHSRTFTFGPDPASASDSSSGINTGIAYRFTNRGGVDDLGARVSHTTTLHDALGDSDIYYGHDADESRHRRSGLISSALNAVAGMFSANQDNANAVEQVRRSLLARTQWQYQY